MPDGEASEQAKEGEIGYLEDMADDPRMLHARRAIFQPARGLVIVMVEEAE